MKSVAAQYATGPTAVIERVFRAPVDKVWALWTTKEGLEKWYWPPPLVADVKSVDVRVNGTYEIAAEGLPHTSRGTYVAVVDKQLLVIRARIDFLEEVEPYDRTDVIEFEPIEGGTKTKVIFTSTKMHSEHWQHRATLGFTASLDKIDRLFDEKGKRT